MPPQPTLTHPIQYEEYKVWLQNDIVSEYFNTYQALGICTAVSGTVTRAIGAGATMGWSSLYVPNPKPYTALILLGCQVAVISNTVASTIRVQLMTLQTAPTGGVAIQPRPIQPVFTTPGSLSMNAWTGGGGVIGIITDRVWNIGVVGAASVINPPPPLNYETLWGPELYTPTNGLTPSAFCNVVGRGWVVAINSTGASSIGLVTNWLFVEQA